jgi:ribosome-associated protein
MIYVTPDISIDESEIQENFIRASGPGGQNVNKVATAVQIRFHVGTSPSLPDDVRRRLIRLAGRRVTEDGLLIIHAHRFRTQKQNRKDAMDRLISLIRKASKKPRPRRKTKPTRASIRRRLDTKRRHSKTKSLRRPVLKEE